MKIILAIAATAAAAFSAVASEPMKEMAFSAETFIIGRDGEQLVALDLVIPVSKTGVVTGESAAVRASSQARVFIVKGLEYSSGDVMVAAAEEATYFALEQFFDTSSLQVFEAGRSNKYSCRAGKIVVEGKTIEAHAVCKSEASISMSITCASEDGAKVRVALQPSACP